jgi:HEAT repeat protein
MHDPAADAGAEDHAEHQRVPAARALHRLGDREAVGVVLDAHRHAEARSRSTRSGRRSSTSCSSS